MMNETIYQAIYNEIEPLLPKSWEKLIVYIEYGTASYSMSFYVGSYDKLIKCFDLPGISDDALFNAFAKIDKFLAPERGAEKDKWSNMTLVVNGDNFKADFDYTDLSVESYKYKKEWKNKYINI